MGVMDAIDRIARKRPFSERIDSWVRSVLNARTPEQAIVAAISGRPRIGPNAPDGARTAMIRARAEVSAAVEDRLTEIALRSDAARARKLLAKIAFRLSDAGLERAAAQAEGLARMMRERPDDEPCPSSPCLSDF